MKKKDLFEKVTTVKTETQKAIQIMYDALNNGQKKQLVKDGKVKKLFDKHGVIYE